MLATPLAMSSTASAAGLLQSEWSLVAFWHFHDLSYSGTQWLPRALDLEC